MDYSFLSRSEPYFVCDRSSPVAPERFPVRRLSRRPEEALPGVPEDQVQQGHDVLQRKMRYVLKQPQLSVAQR